MSVETQLSHPPSAGRVIAITFGALVAGTLILFGAVLPAEFNWDPLGLGRASGLSRLWAPREVAFDTSGATAPLAREYPEGFRTDFVEIPLRAGGDPTRGNELEYKVRLRKDATLVYQWNVADISRPEEFAFDFHGHTLQAEKEMTVATYKQATGTAANGALTAPFDGVHGWFFQNKSPAATVVHLRLSGFYDLIPPGDTGNDAGLIANVPAEKAFGDVEETDAK